MPATTPATRILSVLERLQARPGLTGPGLAEMLGVSERTVRRYISGLKDMGIPIVATTGRVGGYALAAGYRMPPLMLTTDEAVALTLALAAVAPVSPVEADRAVEDSPAVSAFGKLSRVLPRPVAERVVAVRAAVSTPPQVEGLYRRVPLPAILVALAESVVGRCRCRIRHRGQHGPPTVREVNPYGIAALRGSWYLHAWCHLRQARRTFRVDRIDRVDILATTFLAPEGLDIVTAVERSLALARPEWSVELLVHAPLEQVEDWVPRHLGILHAVDSRATGLRSSTSNLDYFAWQIGDLPFAMTVLTPQELRGAFERHAQRMRTVARRKPPPQD